MLKEIFESIKRQWEEWCVLRWWTRKRAAHYVKEDDTELFKNLAEILGKSTIELYGFVVHHGVEKIRLFGHTEVCEYQIRTHKSYVVVDVNLMPFREQLLLLGNNLWHDINSNDILVHYPMYGSINSENRTIQPVYLGTHVILITGKVQESTTIHNHIKWMHEYFMNLEIGLNRVADTPITDPVYANVSDARMLANRLTELLDTWTKELEACRPKEPDEDTSSKPEPEQQEETTDEQPEVN